MNRAEAIDKLKARLTTVALRCAFQDDPAADWMELARALSDDLKTIAKVSGAPMPNCIKLAERLPNGQPDELSELELACRVELESLKSPITRPKTGTVEFSAADAICSATTLSRHVDDQTKSLERIDRGMYRCNANDAHKYLEH